MKELDTPPCHLFEYRGMKFALDPEKLAIVRVDDLGYACLEQMMLTSSIAEAATQLETRFQPDQVQAGRAECLALRSQGMFVGPVTTYDSEDYDRLIRRLRPRSRRARRPKLPRRCLAHHPDRRQTGRVRVLA